MTAVKLSDATVQAGYPAARPILSRPMTRRIRAAAAYVAAFCLFFAIAAASAFAQTDGEGLMGETNDKQVTFFSLGVLLFFVFVVTVGTIIQSALERRKDERLAAHKRQRTGW
jgi:uncharacterized protein involved in response to NO